MQELGNIILHKTEILIILTASLVVAMHGFSVVLGLSIETLTFLFPRPNENLQCLGFKKLDMKFEVHK